MRCVRGVVAELAVIVVAPSGHGAVRAQRQAVATARRDGHHRLAIERGDARSLCSPPPARGAALWCCRRAGRSRCRPRRPRCRPSTAPGCGNHPPRWPPPSCHRAPRRPESVFTATGTRRVRRSVVAELAVVVVAPGGHGAVRAQRQAVVITRRDGHHRLAIERRDARSRVHRHRHAAARRGVVAELAVAVGAPGGHGAVRAQRQAVVIARRDGHHRLAIQRRDARSRVHRHRHETVASVVLSPSWP